MDTNELDNYQLNNDEFAINDGPGELVTSKSRLASFNVPLSGVISIDF